MADFLRDLDPAHRAFLVIFIATMLNGIIYERWARYKAKQAGRPVTMVLRNGVYVPWGTLEKVQWFGKIAVRVWLVYIALVVIAVVYVKVSGIRL